MWVVGRRGPHHASFTTPELRELVTTPGVQVRVINGDFDAIDDADLDRRTRANVQVLREAAATTVGSNPSRVFSTVHRSAGFGGNGSGNAFQVSDACTAFHNYQMLWTAEAVKFGMDGTLNHTYTNPKTGYDAWPFDNLQYMILNIAIGGDLGGPVDDSIFPVTMEVDHVRVWQAR